MDSDSLVFTLLLHLTFSLSLSLSVDSEELSKTAELKAAQTMNMVLGIVTAGCICVVFLIILLLNYCYFRNDPDLKQHHHSVRINAPTVDVWPVLNLDLVHDLFECLVIFLDCC